MSQTIILDNWGTTLSAAILASATSIPLSSPFQSLSAGQIAYLTLADPTNTILETIQITVGGSAPTAVRGVSGTAQAWPAGTTIELRDCAEALQGAASPSSIPCKTTIGTAQLFLQQLLDGTGIDIRFFGAVMNTSSDQTAAFASAFTLLAASGWTGKLLIPPGYILANIVCSVGGITIVGSGAADLSSGGNIKNYLGPYNNSLPALQFGNGGGGLVEGSGFQDLCVYSPSGSGTTGVSFYDGAYKCQGTNVQIVGFSTDCLLFTNNDIKPCSFNMLSGLTILTSSPTGVGVHFIDPGNQTSAWTSANVIENFNITTASYQVVADSASGGSFVNGYLQGEYSGLGILFKSTYGRLPQICFTMCEMDYVADPVSGYGYVSVTLDAAVDMRNGAAYNNQSCIVGTLLTGGCMLVLAAAHTTGSISSSTNPTLLTVNDPSGITPGRFVQVVGAGPSGIPLVASVVSISGSVLTLSTSASTTVTNADTAYGDLTGIEGAGTPGSILESSGIVFGYNASGPRDLGSTLTTRLDRVSGQGSVAPYNAANLVLRTAYNQSFNLIQPASAGIVVSSIVQGNVATSPVSTGTIVTVTTASSHGGASGDLVTIQGSLQGSINTQAAVITYISATSFSYVSPTSAYITAATVAPGSSGGTASFATNQMTLVTAPTSGTVALNQTVSADSVAAGTAINSLISGTLNAPGSVYGLSSTPGTVGTEALTTTLTLSMQLYKLTTFVNGVMTIPNGGLYMQTSTGTPGKVLTTNASNAQLVVFTPDGTNGIFSFIYGSSVSASSVAIALGTGAANKARLYGGGNFYMAETASVNPGANWGGIYANSTDHQVHAVNGANADGVIITTVGVLSTHTLASPTGTVSATAVMMGTGGTVTTVLSSRVLITISGQMANGTAGDGATVDLRISAVGNQTAPTNGAAVSGTLLGIAQTAVSVSAAQKSGFSITAVATGLTVGQAYWIDASLLALTGGTASITGVTVTAIEV